jgi:plasmid stabilization system protein ParE
MFETIRKIGMFNITNPHTGNLSHQIRKGLIMPRGDKGSYSNKQKRQAEHIEEGYEKRGVSGKEAKRRAWATVNKATGGGKKSGSGRGRATNSSPYKKGGRMGGRAKSQS